MSKGETLESDTGGDIARCCLLMCAANQSACSCCYRPLRVLQGCYPGLPR